MTETRVRYPALYIDMEKLRHNTRHLAQLCKGRGIDVAAVTKVYSAIPEVAEAQASCGVQYLADSRLENLRRMKDIPIPKMLLRLPSPSRADEVVECADISLNSELQTLRALSEAAVRAGKTHEVLLMIDLGYLREGVLKEDAVPMAREIVKLPGLSLAGVGVNLTCYGGVLPSPENLGELVAVADEIESRCGVTLRIISGGNSSSLKLMQEGGVPDRINLLRLGESIVLGLETADGTHIPGTHRDVFTLAVEVIELKEKPSMPIGEIGRDAFGEKPVFEDKGMMKRAILSIGRQDARIENLSPRDEGAEIIGASSDHMLLDVTACKRPLKVGDIMEFNLSYGGLLSVITSSYVSKIIR